MNLPLTPEQEAAIRALLPRNKIPAIKLYREATGAGLRDAKEAVERIVAEMGPGAGLPTNSPAKGCLGLVLVVIILGVGVVLRWVWI